MPKVNRIELVIGLSSITYEWPNAPSSKNREIRSIMFDALDKVIELNRSDDHNSQLGKL